MRALAVGIMMIGFGLANMARADDNTFTAMQLQKNCKEIQQAAIGKKYNEVNLTACTAYMASFFDNMILLETLTGKRQFCIPKGIPTTQNTMILDSWIKDNSKIADTTTAAVALFAALKKAFPCTPNPNSKP